MKYFVLAAAFFIVRGEMFDYSYYGCDDPPCTSEECCVRQSGDYYSCRGLASKGEFCSTHPMLYVNNSYSRNCPCKEGLECRTPKSNKRALKCHWPRRRNTSDSG